MSIVGIVLIVIFLVWFISTSNKINNNLLSVEEAKSTIEIALIKRYETLTESAKCAKEFASHEFNLLMETTKARNGMSIAELEQVSNNQDKAFSSLAALAESYPVLRSNELYITVQKQLSEESSWVASAKRLYNSNVKTYNLLIVNFPSSIVALLRGKRRLDFLKENITDKQSISLF